MLHSRTASSDVPTDDSDGGLPTDELSDPAESENGIPANPADAPPSDSDEDVIEPFFDIERLASTVCCAKNCLKHYSRETLLRWVEHRRNFSDEDCTEFVYKMMVIAKVAGAKYKSLGSEVCHLGFKRICMIGSTKFARLRQHLQQGHADALVDLRRSRTPGFFFFLQRCMSLT